MASNPDISPFKINVPDSALDALHQKLSVATFPDELDGAAWDYGSPLADVKRLAKYWTDKFDWRKAEHALNESLPQFTTGIQAEGFEELKIHFLWKQSENQKAIPLLFVHGWPGGFHEVTKLLKELEKLESAGGPAFDVVVPSLPNYAFSEGSKKTGFGLQQYAETCNKLMLKLGFNEYVTQGGDWGFYITRTLGMLYPQHCKASHINMPRGFQPSLLKNPLLALQFYLFPFSENEKKGIERSRWFLKEGSGYRAKQATKPQTIGYALADSPVALLAWIYEKLHDWTDSYPWTEDEICTWISLYWFSTAGPAATVRIYYESVHPPSNQSQGYVSRDMIQKWIPSVKLGVSFFPKELALPPRTWVRAMGPVVYESEYEKGGHFAAWERPDAITKDLKSMFGSGGPAYGIVPGRDGYGRDARL